MGKGLLHPTEEDFGILSPLQYIGQRRTQVTHTGYLPEQWRGRGAQAVDDTVFFLIKSQLEPQHPFIGRQGLEGFIVLQVFLILIDSGKGTHELKAVDEDSNRQICQCRRFIQRYLFQEMVVRSVGLYLQCLVGAVLLCIKTAHQLKIEEIPSFLEVHVVAYQRCGFLRRGIEAAERVGLLLPLGYNGFQLFLELGRRQCLLRLVLFGVWIFKILAQRSGEVR